MSGQSLERAVHAEFQRTKKKFLEHDKKEAMEKFRLKREQATKLLNIVDHDKHVHEMFLASNDPQKFLHDFHIYMETQIRDSDKEWSWTKFRPVKKYEARIAKIESDAKTKMPKWLKDTESMENLMRSDTAAPQTPFPVKKARYVYLEK